MTEQKERLVYRTCPCFTNDIEGIQTWLEDLAKEGLFPQPDSRFLSVFSFRKGAPQKMRYRMEAAEKRGFWSASDGPDTDMRETFASMGWEFIDYFGNYHIYCSADPRAPELNTDPTLQAITLNTLKKEQQSAAVYAVLYPLLYSFVSHSAMSPFRMLVTAGPWLVGSIVGFLLWAFLSSLLTVIRLGRYQKRLKAGESLTQRKDWRKTSHLAKWLRLIPGTTVLMLLISLGILLNTTTARQPLDAAPENLPFVTLEEIFPGAEIQRGGTFGDYNTFVFYDTAFSSNYEWDEYGYVTQPDGTYFCIVRTEFHDTAAPWLAKLTARDHYRYEKRRHNGKRFEEEAAPETAFDTLYLFRSYGILHIIGQEGNQVFHATVQFDDPNDEPCWDLWLQAMEEKLCN